MADLALSKIVLALALSRFVLCVDGGHGKASEPHEALARKASRRAIAVGSEEEQYWPIAGKIETTGTRILCRG